jgi:hypothetical protein
MMNLDAAWEARCQDDAMAQPPDDLEYWAKKGQRLLRKKNVRWGEEGPEELVEMTYEYNNPPFQPFDANAYVKGWFQGVILLRERGA